MLDVEGVVAAAASAIWTGAACSGRVVCFSGSCAAAGSGFMSPLGPAWAGSAARVVLSSLPPLPVSSMGTWSCGSVPFLTRPGKTGLGGKFAFGDSEIRLPGISKGHRRPFDVIGNEAHDQNRRRLFVEEILRAQHGLIEAVAKDTTVYDGS